MKPRPSYKKLYRETSSLLRDALDEKRWLKVKLERRNKALAHFGKEVMARLQVRLDCADGRRSQKSIVLDYWNHTAVECYMEAGSRYTSAAGEMSGRPELQVRGIPVVEKTRNPYQPKKTIDTTPRRG